jgi:predicted anti-sigma-YlaC factor YlaD
MPCAQIKEILPNYVSHAITETQAAEVEEHLCVCNECRLFLGHFIDKPSLLLSEKKQPVLTQEATDTSKIEKNKILKSEFFSLEYIVLEVGALILIFFIYLLIKK